MGYDGQNIDLKTNTDINATIEKVMDQQTLKLLELERVSIEGELGRFDFSGTFNDSLYYVPLDETDTSINAPITFYGE